MAFDFGYFNEFSDPVTFADPVIMGVAKALKLGPYQGAFYQGMGKLPASLTTKEYVVFTRSQTSRDGTIDAAWTKTATSALGISDATLKGLTVGHVLQFGGPAGEAVIVKAIDRTAGTIDIYARGAGGTASATHASGDAFQVIGYAGNDDDLEKATSVSETTSQYTNYGDVNK